MAIYTNITTATSTILIPKTKADGGNDRKINKITVANNSSNVATVSVCVDPVTASPFYFIKNVKIPTGATLVLDDSLSFNSNTYKLRIDNTGTSPDLTVIIA